MPLRRRMVLCYHKQTQMSIDNRPHVILNVAMSADGKTDTIARRGTSISSPEDMARVDRLRADSDAVMVGGHTLLDEDPRLTVKSAELRAQRRARGLAENPVKVGVVSNAMLKLDSRFLNTGPARIMIFTTSQTDPSQIEKLRAHGAEVIIAGEEHVDLKVAMECLKRAGVERLMVEGGGTLNSELLRLRLVDEIFIYIAPLIFGGATAPTFADGVGLTRDEAIQLKLIDVNRDDHGGVTLKYIVQS